MRMGTSWHCDKLNLMLTTIRRYEMNKGATFSLPISLLRLLDDVRCKRKDPTRSDTVRVLLLQALGAMSYLPQSQKKALGITAHGGDADD
jgi:hypothetical protein